MLKAGLIVAFFVLLGRISGFAREWLIAVEAGAGAATDMAVLLLTFPDLTVNLLLGGGLSAALIPAFKKYRGAQGAALLIQALTCISLLFALIALIATLGAIPLLSGLAPGIDTALFQESLFEFRLVTWATPLAALSGVLVAYLNSQEKFALAAAGTLIFNLSIITTLLVASDQFLLAIALGVLAGGILRLALQTHASRTGWVKPERSRWLIDASLMRQFFASFSYVTILVALPPIARAAASFGEPGALALFNFAHKLVELPIGVALGSIAIVLLPKLAGDFAARGRESARATLAAGLRANLLISLAIGIPAACFAESLVRLAFFRAAFPPEQIDTLSMLCAIGFLSLPVQGVMNIYGSAFAAAGHVRPLVVTALIMASMMLLLSGVAEAYGGIQGVMLGYVGCYALGAILLSVAAARYFGPEVFQDAFQRPANAFLAPCCVALLIAWIGWQNTTGWQANLGWWGLSCLGFMLTAGIMDPQLRGFLQRLIEKE